MDHDTTHGHAPDGDAPSAKDGDAPTVGRVWVERPRLDAVAACGRRVVVVVGHPTADGERWSHRIEDRTPGRPPRVLTPPGHDCTAPVLLRDGCLLVRSDGGSPQGPHQVVEVAPTGALCIRTDADGGVLAFAAGRTRVVALERVRPSRPWAAEVVVAGSLPPRHWRDWLTEDPVQLVVYDRRSGVRRPLGPPAGPELSDCTLALSPDGSRLVTTPVRVGEDGVREHGLEVRSLPGGAVVAAVWGPPCSDHSHPVFSPDGRRLAFVRHTRGSDRHGRRQLHVLDLDTGAEAAVAPSWPHWFLPQAWALRIGIVGHAVVAGEVGVFSVSPGDPTPQRLDAGGASWAGVVVADQLWGLVSQLHHRPRLQRVDTPAPPSVAASWHTKTPCPALFWPSDRQGARPLILLVHGGPVSAWTDAFHPRQPAAFFHAAGAHVLLPNPVGSTGYGDAHVDAVWHDWDRCTDQLVALLHQARARPDVSALVVVGGSFGGWASLRLATREDVPALDAVVAHAAIFDHHTMLAGCDEPAAFAWHLGRGGPALHRADPSRHLSGWRVPTLLLHGAQDFNVPVEQALAARNALAARSVPHRLVVFPSEGHHILAPRHAARWWDELARFLSTHVPTWAT